MRRATAFFATFMIISLPATGQDESVPASLELRLYDVRDLLEVVADWHPPRIELLGPGADPSPGGHAGAMFVLDGPTALLSEDALTTLLKANVSPESWGFGKVEISLTPNEQLMVRQTREVHAAIESFLVRLRRELLQEIVVDGTIVLVDDRLLESAEREYPGSSVISEKGWRSIEGALETGRDCRLLRSLRATARQGQMVYAAELHQKAYLQDIDVESSATSFAGDPINGVLNLGAVMAVRPLVGFGQVVMETRFTWQEEDQPIQPFQTGWPEIDVLDQPSVRHRAVETTVSGPIGRHILAGRVAATDFEAGDATNRSVCFFVQPSVMVPDLPDAADDMPLALQHIDVRFLTSTLQDFPAGNLWLFPSTVSGVTNIEAPCEKKSIPIEELVDLIRNDVEPESWSGGDREITNSHGHLIVRQNPAVLKQVGSYLHDKARRILRTTVMGIEIFSLGPENFQDLRRRIPALESGTAALHPADLETIRKSPGMTRIACGEVSGMNGQRVNVRGGRMRTYLRDYDMECSGGCPAPDPIVEILEDGLTLDVRSILDDSGRFLRVELQANYAEQEGPFRVVALKGKAGRMQCPSVLTTPIRASLTLESGVPRIVRIAGPTKIDEKERYLVVVVKATASAGK